MKWGSSGSLPFKYSYTACRMEGRTAFALLPPRGHRSRLPSNRNQNVLVLISTTSPSRREQCQRSLRRHHTSGIMYEWLGTRVSSVHVNGFLATVDSNALHASVYGKRSHRAKFGEHTVLRSCVRRVNMCNVLWRASCIYVYVPSHKQACNTVLMQQDDLPARKCSIFVFLS